MPVVYRRLVSFFLLAYAFTWFGNLGNFLWPSDYWVAPMNPLGPLMAASLFILLAHGRAGLGEWWRRICNFRAPTWVYATALLGPLSIILGSVWLAATFGASTQALPNYEWLEFVILVPVMLLMGPWPEEVSFRGYAQHVTQKSVSPLVTALLIGVGVAIWHAPLVIVGELQVPWLVCIIAVSVVYAWIMNKGGSIWPVVLVHFVVNYFGGNYFGTIIATPDGQLLYAEIFAALFVLWALSLAVLSGPQLGLAGTLNMTEQPAE